MVRNVQILHPNYGTSRCNGIYIADYMYLVITKVGKNLQQTGMKLNIWEAIPLQMGFYLSKHRKLYSTG